MTPKQIYERIRVNYRDAQDQGDIDLFFEPIGMWKSKGFNIPISSQWG